MVTEFSALYCQHGGEKKQAILLLCVVLAKKVDLYLRSSFFSLINASPITLFFVLNFPVIN